MSLFDSVHCDLADLDFSKLSEADRELAEKTVSSKVVYKGRVVTVHNDEAELPDGKVRPRDFIWHPGGVVVLPILDDGRVVFVRQWRYALGHPLLELPAGKLEMNEEPSAAIKRELAEETGYQAKHWEELTYIYTSPGFCNEKLWLYKATGLEEAKNVDTFDDEETIQLICLSPEEIKHMIQDREIIDAKTLCLLGLVFSSL